MRLHATKWEQVFQTDNDFDDRTVLHCLNENVDRTHLYQAVDLARLRELTTLESKISLEEIKDPMRRIENTCLGISKINKLASHPEPSFRVSWIFLGPPQKS